jgi:hypothetical protein
MPTCGSVLTVIVLGIGMKNIVLMTLVECDQAWTINANMAGILYAAGLPQWREELCTFLEEV